MRDEDGAVLYLVAAAMVAIMLMTAVVVDVGRFFEHRRHLQLQADAAALAGAGELGLACTDAAVRRQVDLYGGGTYNPQVEGRQASNVFVELNSSTFHAQSGPTDGEVRSGGPCAASQVDVKMTETDLPLLFADALFGPINAQARVDVVKADGLSGAVPIAVPEAAPRRMRALLVDEATGTQLAAADLQRRAPQGGLSVWDNSTAPVSLAVPDGTSRIGVRLAMSSRDSLQCGAYLVECYDQGSSDGVTMLRAYGTAADPSRPQAPVLRNVGMVQGSCNGAAFSFASTACTVGVSVDLRWAGGTTVTAPAGASVTATVGSTSKSLTYDATSQRWTSGTVYSINPGSGPQSVSVTWRITSGVLDAVTCTTRNPCTGTFANVQRHFSGRDDRTGPLRLVEVTEAGVLRSSVQQGTTRSLVIRVGLQANLQDAQSVGDPVVALRVIGGTASQTQSLDCDPDKTTLKDELALGCAPQYRINAGQPCPTRSSLFSSPQPWTCVANETGAKKSQVVDGLNRRILGSETATTCTSPNRWSDFPKLQPDDKRIVQLLVTPYGSFSGSGSATVPVINFAAFYVTGWTGEGGNSNPCQGRGDDPVPGGDGGLVVGHYIKYVQRLNGGNGGSEPCDPSSFGTCVPVLTR